MINRIKRLYPKYNIYIMRDNCIVDENNKKIEKSKLYKSVPYVLINDNYYEVHQKNISKIK